MFKVMQIAMNTVDLAGSLRLYSEVFGFHNALGQTIWGDLIGVQGLPPESRALLWWMVGGQEEFQLELFHHTQPAIHAKDGNWRPNDLGWGRLGIKVATFEKCLDKLSAQGMDLLGPPTMIDGAWNVAVLDPYAHIVVHVIDDASATAGPMIAYVGQSTSDLDRARHFYGDLLGMTLSPDQLCANSEEDGLGAWTAPGSDASSPNSMESGWRLPSMTIPWAKRARPIIVSPIRASRMSDWAHPAFLRSRASSIGSPMSGSCRRV